jgi:hypothetical protein
MHRILTAAALLLCAALSAAAVELKDDVDITGNYIQVKLSPNDGGVVDVMRLLTGSPNAVGANGLLLEGFGIPSHYVPNRRINEKLESLDEYKDRPVLRFSYDCEGPNIEGLHVTRIMEALPDEASMRVTWMIENKGADAQWLSPWVRNDLQPGGMRGAEDKITFAALEGMVSANRTGWYPAARNWIASTDSTTTETVYSVFHADQTHSFLTLWDEEGAGRGFQAAFAPVMLKPGGTWKTVYRVGIVRGLKRVDFATDELAVQLDAVDGQLVALLAAVKPLKGIRIDASIVAENERVWKLPAKQFDIEPGKVIRCTYPFEPPADGYYDYLAKFTLGTTTLPLGTDTGSPHGGIDARFAVGKPAPRPMEAWTDASHQLDRGARTLKRTLAFAGDADIWIEPSLEKVFSEDKVEAVGAPKPSVQLGLARGEREAFQLCFRPAKQAMISATLQLADLVHTDGGARITPADVTLNDVRYLQVRIPSHFEGPTGLWPDELPPHKPFIAEPGAITTLWVTVHAQPGLPGGLYRGAWNIVADGEAPRPLAVELRVYDFDLPVTPRLKTDFGFWDEAAARGAKIKGGALAKAYLNNALEHRVTLREPLMISGPDADMTAIKDALGRGATQIAVSPDLRTSPEKLKAVNDMIVRAGLKGKVFTPLAYEPMEPGWPKLLEAITQWKAAAPDIPVSVSTIGIRPFLPDACDLWCIHAQVLDTPNGLDILKRIGGGREVWWYVSNTPPRPYGNFFVDFAGIEHRILFWQAWALGIRGMQYWNVDYIPAWQNPERDLLDATPVNGDGALVYPGPDGPINSIRWEIIRDGIEDYDYLSLFMDRRAKLLEQGGQEALLSRAAEVFNLEKIVPSLVTFTRESQLLLQKRAEIAGMIEEMDRALKAGPKKTAAPAAAPAPALPKPEPLPKPAAAAPTQTPPAAAPLPQFPQVGGPTKNFGTGKK